MQPTPPRGACREAAQHLRWANPGELEHVEGPMTSGAPMQESSDHDPGDNQERDIADDPLLSALDADLGRASKKTDNTLLVILLGAGLPLMFAFKILGTGTTKVIGVVAAVVVMISAIPYTMIRTIRLRRQIAIRYGLKCPACGYNPGGMYALSTATVGRCRKCRSELSPTVPGKK